MRLTARGGIERRAIEVDPLAVSRTIGDERIEPCEVGVGVVEAISHGDGKGDIGRGDRPSATRKERAVVSINRARSGVLPLACSRRLTWLGRFSRPAPHADHGSAEPDRNPADEGAVEMR